MPFDIYGEYIPRTDEEIMRDLEREAELAEEYWANHGDDVGDDWDNVDLGE